MSTPTPTRTRSADLFYKEGSSDKVYHIWIENVGANHFVKSRHGRRGSTLIDATKVGPTHAAEAEKIYARVVAEKVSKGYKFSAVGPTGLLGGDSGPIKDDETHRPARSYNPNPNAPGVIPGDTLNCQLLNPITEEELVSYMKDDLWALQEKHDGKRMLIGFNNGKVEAWNRKGQLIEPPREFAACCKDAFGEFNFIIDGEACGGLYYAFDILWLQGMDCRRIPLHERLINLGMLLRSSSSYGGKKQDTFREVVTAFTTAEKRALFKITQKAEHEGVVIKELSAIYTAGRPNSYGPALKYKFVESCTCGVVANERGKRSVGLTKGL